MSGGKRRRNSARPSARWVSAHGSVHRSRGIRPGWANVRLSRTISRGVCAMVGYSRSVCGGPSPVGGRAGAGDRRPPTAGQCTPRRRGCQPARNAGGWSVGLQVANGGTTSVSSKSYRGGLAFRQGSAGTEIHPAHQPITPGPPTPNAPGGTPAPPRCGAAAREPCATLCEVCPLAEGKTCAGMRPSQSLHSGKCHTLRSVPTCRGENLRRNADLAVTSLGKVPYFAKCAHLQRGKPAPECGPCSHFIRESATLCEVCPLARGAGRV
ncbi:MAG: hypothetical protein BWZ02_02694 [Lentisphaerae bacterium ADurb.BinA184]|nr:MAG: hypothetical protein BWZ02_02694 [Lentisphaerae bacterium ADurb.BinA184]